MGMTVHEKSAQVSSSKTDISNVTTYVALIELCNTTAAIAYVQIFLLAAASVNLGTTVPNYVLAVPASGGAVFPFEGAGWKVDGPWCMAGTTGRGNNGSAAVDVTIWKAS